MDSLVNVNVNVLAESVVFDARCIHHAHTDTLSNIGSLKSNNYANFITKPIQLCDATDA